MNAVYSLHPPSAERIHKRALALAYLACRAMIDGDPNPSAPKMAEAIRTFVAGVRLEDVLEPAESRLVNAPFGAFREFEREETSWTVEGVAVLAWAIGKTELPPYWCNCNGATVSVALGMFRPETRETLGESRLRDANEIEMCALSYLVLNQRIGQYIASPGRMNLAVRLRDPNSPHLLVEGIELIDDDLAIDGLPLSQVEAERFGEVAQIVRERFNALKWLQGYSAWYGVSVTVH
jgi:hypothetical protein